MLTDNPRSKRRKSPKKPAVDANRKELAIRILTLYGNVSGVNVVGEEAAISEEQETLIVACRDESQDLPHEGEGALMTIALRDARLIHTSLVRQGEEMVAEGLGHPPQNGPHLQATQDRAQSRHLAGVPDGPQANRHHVRQNLHLAEPIEDIQVETDHIREVVIEVDV